MTESTWQRIAAGCAMVAAIPLLLWVVSHPVAGAATLITGVALTIAGRRAYVFDLRAALQPKRVDRQTQRVFRRCGNSEMSRVQSECVAFCRHCRASPASGQNPADSGHIRESVALSTDSEFRTARRRRRLEPASGR